MASPGAPSRRSATSNTRMRSLMLVGVGLIILAALLLRALLITHTTGGPAMPWNPVLTSIRETIREVWAGFTGQPITRDLFP